MTSTDVFQSVSNLPCNEQMLFTQYGRGQTTITSHHTVHTAIEHIVDKYPTAVAAKHGRRSIAYFDLDMEANRLANHLLASGLRPKQRVCLVVERSLEMIVGMISVMKAGCQYVVVDGRVGSVEAVQQAWMDADASFVLCQPQFEVKVRLGGRGRIATKSLRMGAEVSRSWHRPSVPVSPNDGAYFAYASGGAGQPIGVDVSHRNVTNALLNDPGRMGIAPGIKVGQLSGISFDVGTWEILACLMNGGTLCISGSNWEETLREIDVLMTTPSTLSTIRRHQFPNIKTVVTSREPRPQNLADEWAMDSTFYNAYGLTKGAILSSMDLHVRGQPLTIGVPVSNTTVYTLNGNGVLVAMGEKGLMWLGGINITRGYINEPHRDRLSDNGSTMFNTGDIVRWRHNGFLEFFGSLDDQVKIKGFDVEPHFNASIVEKFPGISRAYIKVVDGKLTAFYTANNLVDEEALEGFARRRLPFYPVPEKFVYVAAFPLTSNGKVDTDKLADMSLRATQPTPPSIWTARFEDHDTDIERGDGSTTCVSKSSLHFDKEDATAVTSSRTSSFTTNGITLPPKKGFHGQRWLRYRALMLYRRFFCLIIFANVAAVCVVLYWRIMQGCFILGHVSLAFASNLTLAIIMRSEPVINILFTVCASVPKSWPLVIRRHAAKIFHLGGIHSGSALSAILWFTIFTVDASVDYYYEPAMRHLTLAPIVLTWLVWPILISMAILSYPALRAQHHDLWEMTHRFGGWTVVALLWVQTFLSVKDLASDMPTTRAWLTSPSTWLLVVATGCLIVPWLSLRKVPVQSEVLSNHAVRLWFDYSNPVPGTAVRLAERPLIDWHGFATIRNAGGRGFSCIISNAGDFTRRTIAYPPSRIWVRGMPTTGVLRIVPLFRRVVLVATGSGIGPILAHIMARQVPCRILWTTPNPEQTFGKPLVDVVLEGDPHAIIHNTRTMGKPDMPLLAWKLYKESNAEAVLIISNKTLTDKVVYALENRGVPAYGALFDS